MTRSAGFRFHENVHGVYFDDLDALGILHNARYLLLAERTIGSFWQHLGQGGVPSSQADDRHHLVRANTIEYLRAIEGTGEVRVRVWLAKLGTTSLTFGFAVLPMDEDSDTAFGTRVVVHVDAARRPTPWTDAFRSQLAPWVRPG